MHEIRLATASDTESVQQLYRRTIRDAAWLAADARARTDFADVSQGESVYVSYAPDGRLKGFVSVYESDSFVHHLYVAPEFARRGVGTALFAFLHARLPFPWRLKCVRANAAALAFYASLGWREVGSGDSEQGACAVLQFGPSMPSAIPVTGTTYAVLLNHRFALDALGDAMHDKPYDQPPVAPVLYLRPANTWNADGATVVLPDDVDEVEIDATLGIVFERATSHAPVADALEHVRGYVVVADLAVPHASVYRPAIRQRNRDGFCVFASRVFDAATIASLDLHALKVETSVDGRVVETSNTEGLIRDVPTLIAEVSAFMRFDAGDVLLVGAIGKPVRARRGDEVRVEIDGLGAASLTIATASEQSEESADLAESRTPIPLPASPLKGEGPSRRRNAALRRGRIAWQGAIHDVSEADGRVRLADGRLLDEAQPMWLPPLPRTPRPRSIFALGLNYADHAKELAFKAPEQPLIFMKGDSALLGHRGVTLRPRDAAYMHYECELAVVIGRTARHVKRDDAYDFIAGYTVANDYAIRDYLENYYRPNLRVKNREGTTPIGPWLVDVGAVSDPMNLRLTTRVNGKTTQHGSTRDMIFDVPFLVEYLSAFMTLAAGDVILTGTPEGLVDTPVGSVIETEIEAIGRLINTIAADERT